MDWEWIGKLQFEGGKVSEYDSSSLLRCPSPTVKPTTPSATNVTSLTRIFTKHSRLVSTTSSWSQPQLDSSETSSQYTSCPRRDLAADSQIFCWYFHTLTSGYNILHLWRNLMVVILVIWAWKRWRVLSDVLIFIILEKIWWIFITWCDLTSSILSTRSYSSLLCL